MNFRPEISVLSISSVKLGQLYLLLPTIYNQCSALTLKMLPLTRIGTVDTG